MSSQRPPWKKLLWLKQDYPDNYTDSSFLSQLKRNTTVVNYSYLTLINDFTLIVLHLSTILLVLIVFYGLYNLHWNPLVPVSASSVATLVGYLVYQSLGDEQSVRQDPHQFDTTLKSTALILLLLLVLSPVLKSLTNSTSSDSIWALSCWLCILNFIFNDYSLKGIKTLQQQQLQQTQQQHSSGANNNLSKNLSLSNAIVLASRLDSNMSVFCFVLFSIQINGLFPIFNNFVRLHYEIRYHYLQVLLLVCGVNYLYYRLSVSYFVVITVAEFAIVVLGPAYFIRLQKYKDELQGPWDPAKPIFNTQN